MKVSKLDQLTSLFFGTSRLIREHTKTATKADSATFLRMGTLRYITEHTHPTMQDVAKFLAITPPSATSLINGLIKSGLISRVADVTDRRMVRLEITVAGKRVVEKARHDMIQRMKEVLSKLDDKDVDDFIRIMQKLHHAYKK